MESLAWNPLLISRKQLSREALGAVLTFERCKRRAHTQGIDAFLKLSQGGQRTIQQDISSIPQLSRFQPARSVRRGEATALLNGHTQLETRIGLLCVNPTSLKFCLA